MELTYREELLVSISEGLKSLNGFRPDLSRYSDMTTVALYLEAQEISNDVQKQIEEEELAEAQIVQEFESQIADVINIGAGDRETAIRWILQAVDHCDDAAYACFILGLPYSYTDEFRSALSAQ